MEKLSFKKTVADGSPLQACDFLAVHAGLSKARVKDAMNKGACWLGRKGQGRIRLRKATFLLKKGDTLELHYDPILLALDAPAASCLQDYGAYSLWFKPANLLSQGTDYGDHMSLLRQAETFFNPRREVYLVHRLDREASGLMLVAHNRQTAGKLSGLFQDHAVVKRYRVDVAGLMEKEEGSIDQPLDGKEALTRYRVLSRDPETNVTMLLVEIDTGRLHQIRRHLSAIGHPVMGDPRYGEKNKDGRPLRLTACELQWPCPITGERRRYKIEDRSSGA